MAFKLKDFLSKESHALIDLRYSTDEVVFNDVVRALETCEGVVVCIGVGKSTYLAKKFADSLCSIGVRAVGISPSNMMHGNLGFLRDTDVIFAISRSGETLELNECIKAAKARVARVISVCPRNTTAASLSDDVLHLHVEESSPDGILPMAHCTAALALTNAITAAIITNSGVSLVSKYHPAGTIGTKYSCLPDEDFRIFIGWEASEKDAWRVAEHSMRKHTPEYPIRAISMDHLPDFLYHRPTVRKNGQLWDVISDAPMSTAHSIARFFIPEICKHTGYALFTDGDILVRDSVDELYRRAASSPEIAVWVVKQEYTIHDLVKKGGQQQTQYRRKNWSSVMLFNCSHPTNRKLTVELLNTLPGRDLHQFFWLTDNEIGSVGCEWNWIPGHSPSCVDPAIVHFSDGLPSVHGYESVAFAQEWRDTLAEVCK